MTDVVELFDHSLQVLDEGKVRRVLVCKLGGVPLGVPHSFIDGDALGGKAVDPVDVGLRVRERRVGGHLV